MSSDNSSMDNKSDADSISEKPKKNKTKQKDSGKEDGYDSIVSDLDIDEIDGNFLLCLPLN